MLHPKHNLVDYGDQLIPPDGYELSYAVGTTYSLDLESLMILPVALFYAQKLDANASELRYDMLHAITEAAKKMTVFYQKGQLKVPKNYHHLMAYLEEGIQELTMPNAESSFHPKVWVIRYESKEAAPMYKVLVTSKNLTFSRDWDISFSTQGLVTNREHAGNKPLVHLIQYLEASGSKKFPPLFIADLHKVTFDIPDKFAAFRFVPVGIPNPATGQYFRNPLTALKKNKGEMLIVSPFLDQSTLKNIREDSTGPRYLLSRKEELDAIDETTLNGFDCWQFSNYFETAEFQPELEDGGSEPPIPQNLHAKLFVSIQESAPFWFLGSANCTDPAQGRNVEFMVELKAENAPALKPKNLFDALTKPEKSDNIPLFTKYDFTARVSLETQKSVDNTIRRLKYELCKIPLRGIATLTEGGGTYNLSLEIDASTLSIPAEFTIKVKPLPEQQKASVALQPQKLNAIDSFGPYAETALSAFLAFEIFHDGQCSEFLLPMEIDLPSSRLNKIFSAIIDSREKFLKYLGFLLSGENTERIEKRSEHETSSMANHNGSGAFMGAPVYEKLLLASSRFPERLKAIDELVERLKKETADSPEPIITKEFEDFWSVFQTFINIPNR